MQTNPRRLRLWNLRWRTRSDFALVYSYPSQPLTVYHESRSSQIQHFNSCRAWFSRFGKTCPELKKKKEEWKSHDTGQRYTVSYSWYPCLHCVPLEHEFALMFGCSLLCMNFSVFYVNFRTDNSEHDGEIKLMTTKIKQILADSNYFNRYMHGYLLTFALPHQTNR